MKEAISKIIEFLYDFGYDKIIYSYDEGNIKSKRLYEKLMFDPYKTIENS